MSSHPLLAVVIPISWGESAQRAVSSVLSHHHLVRELILVHRAFKDDASSMYAGWVEHRARLVELGIRVHVTSRDVTAKDLADQSLTVVEVPPMCELKLGALETIRDRMGSSGQDQRHFALATVTKAEGFDWRYGFLVVLFAIDWLWSFWERGKLAQTTDVRCRQVLRKGNRAFLPVHSQLLARFWNFETIRTQYCDNAILSVAESGLGSDYVGWVFHHHAHLRLFGFWIFPFLLIYPVLTFSMVLGPIYTALNFSWIYSWVFVAVWVGEMTTVALMTRNYLKLDYRLIYYFLFPLYFALFPIYLIDARLHQSKRMW